METIGTREPERTERAPRPKLKILLVEDEPSIAQTLYEILGEEGHRVTLSTDGAQAMSRIDAEVFDVVITDIRLPNVDGLTIFARLREEAPTTRVVLMSAYGTIAEAVRAMKEKAAHYLAKPFDLNELIHIVDHIAEERRIENEIRQAEMELHSDLEDKTIVGSTPAIVLIKRSIPVIAKANASVLITGESGSGKELVARAIHERSTRAGAPFIAVNCAALPEQLLEAELFGHERGAFTGAVKRREGRFRAAQGGTLFLDEVGDMAPSAQAKLLRALEDGGYEPLGTNETEKPDVRVISATNADLQARVEEGRFRVDLFYRLKVFQLRLPPLRERRPDLPLLIKHFYENAGGKSEERIPATPRAWAALNQYRFPGNVRELRHAIEHAVVLAQGAQIDLEHLPDEIRGRADTTRAETDAGPPPLPTAVREFEREYLIRTLMLAGGQKQRAADMLGISRKTLWVKLRQYGIHDFDSDE